MYEAIISFQFNSIHCAKHWSFSSVWKQCTIQYGCCCCCVLWSCVGRYDVLKKAYWIVPNQKKNLHRGCYVRVCISIWVDAITIHQYLTNVSLKKVNGRNKYIRNWSRQWYLLVMNKSKATEQHIGKRDRQREKKKVTARKQTWQWDFRTSNVSKCSMIKKELKLNEFYFISLIHSFIHIRTPSHRLSSSIHRTAAISFIQCIILCCVWSSMPIWRHALFSICIDIYKSFGNVHIYRCLYR